VTDQVGVYNLCLGRLGVGQAVGAPTENSVPAKTCNRFYDQCRQEVLRAFPWPFALRAEPLALVVGQTFPGWTYVYQYPSGCLTMRAVGDESGMRQVRSSILTCDPCQWTLLQQVRQPWQPALKADGASQVLLTDIVTAWGFFTADVTNTGAWPVDFGGVVADRLAMEVGGPLQAKADLVTAAANRYAVWFSMAAATSMNEQKDDRVAESPSITARY
jgi:hypothetical protein